MFHFANDVVFVSDYLSGVYVDRSSPLGPGIQNSSEVTPVSCNAIYLVTVTKKIILVLYSNSLRRLL